MNILDKIATQTQKRVAASKKILPLAELKKQANAITVEGYPFEAALRKSDDIAFICEVKKASPSKGVIAEHFPHIEIARDYETAGAAAISVLTEPDYFLGSDNYLREIANSVKIPLLRKDFTVDDYMIYEAKVLGASAVLLICSILDMKMLVEYIDLAHSLGLSALVEAHDDFEVETALKAGARIIGVNNRNLRTFEVDITLSEQLRKLVPSDKLFVAESGIRTAEDVASLREFGANAVLIGETIMRSTDKRAEIEKLRGGK